MICLQAGVVAFVVTFIFYLVGVDDARSACIVYFLTAFLWIFAVFVSNLFIRFMNLKTDILRSDRF